MYTLGIPNRQYRRCTQVLGPESADPIEYDAYKQDDGFWQFSFPEVDEYGFRDIVNLLKANGVTTIGADDQLTEKNIMKLSKLIKEQGSPDENEMIDILKRTLESWEKPDYKGGLESCEKSDHYFEDIKDIIEDYEEEATMDRPSDLPAFGGLNEIYNSLTEQENKGLNRMDRDMTPEEEFLMNNPSPGTSTPMGASGNTTKIKLKMSNIEDEVTITEKPGKVLEDVTISWGNESHTVTFEEEGQIDDHGNEGMDLEFMAESDDGQWQFILDVYAEASYPNTDPVEWDWEELIIQDHPDNEDHLDPEDRTDFQDDDGSFPNRFDEDIDEGTCGYGKNGKTGKKPAGPLQERFKKLAGIIK